MIQYRHPTLKGPGPFPLPPEWQQLQDSFEDISLRFPVGVQDVGNRPSCRVYNNAAISINNTTLTALTFNSERYDDPINAMHSVSSNTGRITVVVPGVYTIGASIAWDSNATGDRLIGIQLNGSTILDQRRQATTTTSEQGVNTQYRLVATDFLEVVVRQSSGGALNVSASANYSPEFYATWLAP